MSKFVNEPLNSLKQPFARPGSDAGQDYPDRQGGRNTKFGQDKIRAHFFSQSEKPLTDIEQMILEAKSILTK